MADVIDIANDREQKERDLAIAATRKELAPGLSGDCELCGEWSGRLVNAACAPCRDKYKLP